MAKDEDILSGKDIPEEAITFFRQYQKSLVEKWYLEKNGRFAQNFRYYMLAGLQKKIPTLDLLVAAAILFSHEESYIKLVLGEESEDSIVKHELSRIRERVLSLAEYMSKNGIFLLVPHNALFSRVRLRLGLSGLQLPREKSGRSYFEYMEFFCNLPAVWEEQKT